MRATSGCCRSRPCLARRSRGPLRSSLYRACSTSSVALGVGELEGVDAEIGQRAKADRGGLLGCEERLGDRMRLEEFLERRRLRSIRPACGDGEQEVAEFAAVAVGNPGYRNG